MKDVLLIIGVDENSTNAGDFLVAKGIENLLKRFEIKYEKITSAQVSLGKINQYCAIVTGGGPHYSNRLYNNDTFGIKEIYKKINIPIFYEGSGIYNATCSSNDLYNNEFENDMKDFYIHIDESGGGYGCRDYLTKKILKKNGLMSGKMIGCPAWYADYDASIQNLKIKSSHKIKKILVSDVGLSKNNKNHFAKAQQVIEVLQYIRQKFSDCEIVFTFNNGIETKYSTSCNLMIKDYLEKNHIVYYNLVGSDQLFGVNDEADLHIGFRLHSHIYCLRNGIPSILLEEDARGYGFNDTVGLPHLLTYKEILDDIFVPNEYLEDELDLQIDKMVETRYIEIFKALDIMKTVFDYERTNWMNRILKIQNES